MLLVVSYHMVSYKIFNEFWDDILENAFYYNWFYNLKLFSVNIKINSTCINKLYNICEQCMTTEIYNDINNFNLQQDDLTELTLFLN